MYLLLVTGDRPWPLFQELGENGRILIRGEPTMLRGFPMMSDTEREIPATQRSSAGANAD